MTVLRTFAILITVLIVIPSGTHLFEMPAKLHLERDTYFAVQGIYAGWAWFGAPIIIAVLANLALFLAERRREPSKSFWALCAAALIGMSLLVFFVWVFPANQATSNWTVKPDNWEDLRRQWEYGHAAVALLVGLALASVTLASVRRKR